MGLESLSCRDPTDELQLLVETGLLEGTAGGDVCLATNPAPGGGHGGLFWPGIRKMNVH